MIALAVREGITERTELTTNATALTEEKSRQLHLNPASIICASASTPQTRRERNEAGSQSKIPIERIFENVKTFRKLR